MSKQTELAQVADTITVNSGKIGIGTDSPARTLEVYSSAPAIKLNNGTNAFTIGTGAFVDGSNSLVFFDEGVGERMRLDASGNLLVGSTTTDGFDGTSGLKVANSVAGFLLEKTGVRGWLQYIDTSGGWRLYDSTDNAERILVDTSGNLLVGKTSSNSASVGVEARANGTLFATKASSNPAGFNRTTSDGAIVIFYKDNSTVGSIGVKSSNNLYIAGSAANHAGLEFGTSQILPMRDTASSDNTVDLGNVSTRFDDIYATNGTIQTSDRNEKQDIAELSDAEQRVAVAAKGLMRKFRWRDAVEAKGDDARTHFGIIAQDLQAAFAAEGLDAGDYAMFISTTWWETQTEVPAVEAVAEVTETTTDEDGNEVITVVTEAVEAKDAYTRTDTYDTQEEAPEGATERTRLGVRYSELLAFIVGAL